MKRKVNFSHIQILYYFDIIQKFDERQRENDALCDTL